MSAIAEQPVYTPTLGLDYAVYERNNLSCYGWSSWSLMAVFLNEKDALEFCPNDTSHHIQRQVFVTKSCWENWHTQAQHHHHEGCRKMFREWIEKYADAHITGALSRYQLPDL